MKAFVITLIGICAAVMLVQALTGMLALAGILLSLIVPLLPVAILISLFIGWVNRQAKPQE